MSRMLSRRGFLGRAAAGAAMGAAAPSSLGAAAAEDSAPPLNVLWITCEDIGPHLGCYGDPDARTPNLDRLAAEGLRYTRAFSVSGVCAPSRSCLITGMYPTTLGTCHMRCKNPPPEHVRCFPAYLRRAGYYCTNNAKTDYQFEVPPDAWDQCDNRAHWRNRERADQPFFAVFNFTTTHESRIGDLNALPDDLAQRIPDGRHDPARVTLPPYYPDTEVIRRHWAHYHDLISAMDAQAGDILRQLDEDGLADNTVVFFFSDHGAGLPRAKRWMYDSGLHVPFLVRWPGRLDPGAITDRLVSFVDFGPTVLSIADVSVPAHMQGRPFLGAAEAAPRAFVFAARDRMDERYDLIRATRDTRYKYIRNYLPHRPYAEYLTYCESWPVMQELRRVRNAGGLDESQALFFRPVKPIEELYDTEADPHELRNLAESPAHVATLERLRRAMDIWLDESRDLGFVPEPELEAWLPAAPRPRIPAPPQPYGLDPPASATLLGLPLQRWMDDLNGDQPLRRMRAVATLGLAPRETAPVLAAALDDPDVCVAYWAAVALGYGGVDDPEVVARLTQALERTESTARLGAASALCDLGRPESAAPVLVALMDHAHFATRLLAAQGLERLEPRPEEATRALEAALDDDNGYVVRVVRRALGMPPQR